MSLLLSGLAWLDKRVLPFIKLASSNHPIVWASIGLIGSSLAIPLSDRYAKLPSDAVFLVVILVLLSAIWIAARSSAFLFGKIEEQFHWDGGTRRVIAMAIFGLGVVLQHVLGLSNGLQVFIICGCIAAGCSGMGFLGKPKPNQNLADDTSNGPS